MESLGVKLRTALAGLAIVVLMLLTTRAVTQQEYTFEDACRMAGQTTGACAPASEQEQSLGCIPLATNAFHPNDQSRDCINATLSPVLDIEIFVELIGLENLQKINELELTIARSPEIKNARAAFYGARPIIVINPEWARSKTAESYLILAHEAGHHFCRHGLDDPLRRKKEELEADRFAGASILRFEIYHSTTFLGDMLNAADRLFSEAGSGGYPPKAVRIEAIKEGYETGSPCGDFAPGTPGFSPELR